ncbi:MAG TPA: FAD-dependent oxidoreductase [Gemmatimonas sp.]|nr:FAD-dependent oxidoreductase [Gemmatimonas sp.]
MMRSNEGARPSIWDVTAPAPDLQPFSGDATIVDVCVIGAGIAGLTTALELLRAGREVLVLDDGPLAGGETGRTTAHLATAFDDEYNVVESMHGHRTAQLLAESFRAGVDAIERNVREESIDCGFTRLDGWWVPSTDDASERLEAERDAAHRCGFPDVELVTQHPLAGTFPGPALRFPNQAQFHITRYMAGLAAAIDRLGGRIRTAAHVQHVDDATGESRMCTVKLDDGRTVQARDVVVATNSPMIDRVVMHTKQASYRTYVIAVRVRAGMVPPGLFWDTDDPYHYVRLLDGPLAAGAGDVLIVGGEDHKTGQSDDERVAFDRLEAWTRERFPCDDVVAKWSGQVMEPNDFLAYIGRNPGSERLWIVTGDSGNGMTHGTIAGLMLPTLMAGQEHPWESMYSPGRITLTPTSAVEFLKENVNVAAQYADLVTGGDVDDASAVPRGEGRILRQGARKLAVHRGDDDRLTVRSAVCPHLGCIVQWNTAECTWDCPCHGSRFATDGEVLNGPSAAPLAPATLDQSAAER